MWAGMAWHVLGMSHERDVIFFHMHTEFKLNAVHGSRYRYRDRADLERIVTIVIEFQFVVIGIEKRGPGREGLEGLGAPLECASL